MKKQLTTLLVSAFLANASFAQQQPLAYPSDSRIKMVAYQENNVVPVNGVTFTTTQIIFSQDEYVIDVEGGDTSGWMVTTPDNLPNMVFVKPTLLNSDSNMLVVTNKHNYYFHVTSNKTLSKDSHQTYAIKFSYPEDERKRLKAKLKLRAKNKRELLGAKKNPKAYNWSYSFSGAKQIMPLHVFDDGTFTYFELRKNQPVPAVFVVDNKQGKESVVNTRQQGDYLVVQRTAPQFTLRNGQKFVASVFNQKEIAAIKRGRG